MNVLFAASEGVPFCKTGGLADVIGALPLALEKAGHTVASFLPLYKEIDRTAFKITATPHSLPLRIKSLTKTATLWTAPSKNNVSYYFIEVDDLFERDGIYGYESKAGFADNHLRYAFFCKAILEFSKQLNVIPDVVHGHDWHVGLLPFFLKQDPVFSKTKSVFSIHNMAYQGDFSLEEGGEIGLTDPRVQNNGKVNFLKSALIYADVVNTVSPSYAKEIRGSREYGLGLEGVLDAMGPRFQGIVNGLDVDLWNPEKDPMLAKNFNASTLSSREACKKDLQSLAGFTVDNSIPVLGFVGRLDPLKGIEILIETIQTLVKKNVQIFVLGRGSEDFQNQLKNLQKNNPTKVYVESEFAEPLAHKIYAGADLFLMPSLFEPCGLGQLIAMRYGALPIVNPTGGLIDTVKNINGDGKGNGFVAAQRSAEAFLKAVEKGLKFIGQTEGRQAVQKHNLQMDYSWDKSVLNYIDLYEKTTRQP